MELQQTRQDSSCKLLLILRLKQMIPLDYGRRVGSHSQEIIHLQMERIFGLLNHALDHLIQGKEVSCSQNKQQKIIALQTKTDQRNSEHLQWIVRSLRTEDIIPIQVLIPMGTDYNDKEIYS